MFYFYAIN